MPEGVEPYKSNPLWQVLAEGMTFKPLFVQKKGGQRHINIGELRAALKVESKLGQSERNTRILLGCHSQVALGAPIKGRSSSPFLNRELCQSVPLMLAFDSYLECMYFETSVNRADDPTRGREVRGPSVPLPEWWTTLARGDTEEFDKWRDKVGLDDVSVSGLPGFSELGYKEFSEEGREENVSPFSLGHFGLNAERLEEEETTGTTTAGKSEGEGRKAMSSKVQTLLRQFSEDQFVLPAGTRWPPSCPGFLDLVSGEREE